MLRDATTHISVGSHSTTETNSPSTLNSSTSFARWKLTQEASASACTPSNKLLAGDPAEVWTMASNSSGSKLSHCRYEEKRSAARYPAQHDASTPPDAQPMSSADEYSLPPGMSESTPASRIEQPQQNPLDAGEWHERNFKTHSGDDPTKLSFSRPTSPTINAAAHRTRGSVRPISDLCDGADASVLHITAEGSATTVAIANAVPRIAQERTSATEARANRWSQELQRSTATEEELRHLYQDLERELAGVRRAATTAEAVHKREMNLLTQQLKQETEARTKSEKDLEEILNHVLTPSQTPRSSHPTPAEAEGKDGDNGGGHRPAATHAHASDLFYDKLKEREERARARVRKDFVRQAQENLHAEQRRSAEAEKAADAALKRLGKAEDENRKLQEALQEATSVLEAKDVQLYERGIHIEELETQYRLLEQKLANLERLGHVSSERAAKNLEELKLLADRRQSELEAQRQFIHQLQEKIGITTRDLHDRETDQESVLRNVHHLQARCRRLEGEFDTELHDATALLEQRRQRAEDEAKLLQERNDELRQRCATMKAELEELQASRGYGGSDVEQLRARYEKELGECHVEIRSLQLQLEQISEVAKRRSAENHAMKEIGNQQHAALARQYAAEAKAAQEELDRVKAQRDRESEKHLNMVLELSQQITKLKQENTRLEHAVNVHEHESADATRLLDSARQELGHLREKHLRLSASRAEYSRYSRMNSVLNSQEDSPRHHAEFGLLQQVHISPKERRASSGPRNNPNASNPTSSPQPTYSVPVGGRGLIRSQPHSMDITGAFTGTKPGAADLALWDLLEELIRKLQFLAGQPQDIAAPPQAATDRRSAQESSPPPSIDAEERRALERVLMSCVAALECNRRKRSSSQCEARSVNGTNRSGISEESQMESVRAHHPQRRDALPSASHTPLEEGSDEWLVKSPSLSGRRQWKQRVPDDCSLTQDTAKPHLCADRTPEVPLGRPQRSSQLAVYASQTPRNPSYSLLKEVERANSASDR